MTSTLCCFCCLIWYRRMPKDRTLIDVLWKSSIKYTSTQGRMYFGRLQDLKMCTFNLNFNVPPLTIALFLLIVTGRGTWNWPLTKDGWLTFDDYCTVSRVLSRGYCFPDLLQKGFQGQELGLWPLYCVSWLSYRRAPKNRTSTFHLWPLFWFFSHDLLKTNLLQFLMTWSDHLYHQSHLLNWR